MEIKIINRNNKSVAVIVSEKTIILCVQDALDLMANCNYKGASDIIIEKKHISEAFFDLKTGLAGDILQKFSNYRSRLAVVGDFSQYTSKSLKDFIYESNLFGRINFVRTTEEAKQLLFK